MKDQASLMEEANAALERLEFVTQVLSDCRDGSINYDGAAANVLVQIIGDATDILREALREMSESGQS